MPQTVRLAFALACAAAAGAPFAGAQGAPAATPPARALMRVALRAGRLLDVRTGAVTRDAVIVVEGDRIASVGSPAPSGVAVIELADLTVLPGLIDAHDHVLGDAKDMSATSGLRMSAPQAAIWGVRNIQVMLQHGFTGLRDACEMSNWGYGQVALRNSVARGLVRGPRIAAAGECISLTGGHGDENVLAPEIALPRAPNLADSPYEMDAAVRRDIKYGADWIKLMATGGVGDPISDFRVLELSEEAMARAVAIAHRAGKRVMAHAEGTEGIKAATRAGVDSIEHGTVMDDEGAELMARRGTWLVPTLETFQRGPAVAAAQGADPASVAKMKAILPLQKAGFEAALKHGVRIAYGVDDDVEFVSKEFEALVRGGMTPLAAIQAATVNAAELLGWSADAGALEAGKLADVVAVAGDPLADIGAMERVVFVMKGGEVVRDDAGRSRRP